VPNVLECSDLSVACSASTQSTCVVSKWSNFWVNFWVSNLEAVLGFAERVVREASNEWCDQWKVQKGRH
jgi:hypothetical protein